MDKIIKNGKVVIPKVGIVEANIAIKDGKIAAILEKGETCEAKEVIDASGKYIMPGLIDPHVHWGLYGDPLPDSTRKESASAAIGGFTTALQYRRSPVFDKENISKLLDDMSPNTHIDYSLQLFVTMDRHKDNISCAVKEMGVTSFKFFTTEREERVNSDINGLSDSNIPEPYTDGFCIEAMEEMAKYDGKVVANFHPENYELVEKIAPKVRASGAEGLAAWDLARPEMAEAETIARLGYFAEKTGCPLYLVHISCKEAADKLAECKKSNEKIWGETCPHYLLLNTESPIGELGKVNPPLRDKKNNEALWKALADGTIDTVGSDNCACKKEVKDGNIWSAAPGFAGTATILPALLSEGYHKGRLSLERIAEVTSYNAAKIFNLYPQKGTIMPGADADLVIVDLEKEQEVKAENLKSYSDFSVFEGWNFKGWPTTTILRGEVIAQDGKMAVEPGYGNYLKRNGFLKK